MQQVETTRQDGNLLLSLRGGMGMAEAGELRGALLAALGEADRLEIDLSQVELIQVPCLQLLCAAHKTARNSAKQMIIRPGASEAFRETVETGGYLRRMGCAGENDPDCLWNREGQ